MRTQSHVLPTQMSGTKRSLAVWLASPNKFTSELVETSFTNKQSLLLWHMAIAFFGCCALLLQPSWLASAIGVLWLALAATLSKRGGVL